MDVFNVKIIEYANGQVEIRKYSVPIGIDKLNCINETKEQVARKISFGKRKSELERQGDLMFNPFNKKVERLQTFEQVEIEKERVKKNLKDSLNRTRQELYKISRQCKWEYFITLTFSPDLVDRTDYVKCMQKANKWFNNQRSRYADDLQYVFVPELHEDKKSWHIHGLIAQVGNMSFVDSGHKSKGKIIYNLGGWKYGFSTAVEVGNTQDDVFRVSNYITKYITKDLCEITKGKRRYFRSQNIPAPIEYIEWLKPSEVDNYIDKVVGSLGVSLDYEKTVDGFVGVNYRYYKHFEESEDKKSGRREKV